MKKTFLIAAITMTLSVSTAFAHSTGSNNAKHTTNKFVAKDGSVESVVCAVAGERGYDAAQKAAKEANVQNMDYLACNGKQIEEFARLNKAKGAPSIKAFVNVSAKDASKESQLCVLAAQEGIKSISSRDFNISCDGVSIVKFAKMYN